MKDFAGKIAIVTGGRLGNGGANWSANWPRRPAISRCAMSPKRGWRKRGSFAKRRGLPQGLRVTTHLADVSDAAQVERFRDEVAEHQGTDKIHLLFNNAGIGGGRQHVRP